MLKIAEEKAKEKIVEKLMQNIIEQKVSMSIIATKMEDTVNLIVQLLQQLRNISHFTQQVLDKMQKIDEDLKDSVNKLSDGS